MASKDTIKTDQAGATCDGVGCLAAGQLSCRMYGVALSKLERLSPTLDGEALSEQELQARHFGISVIGSATAGLLCTAQDLQKLKDEEQQLLRLEAGLLRRKEAAKKIVALQAAQHTPSLDTCNQLSDQPVTGAAASASSAEPTSTQSHRANVGNSTAPTSKQAKGVAGIFASMQQGLAGLFAWTQAAVSADSSSDADDSCSEHAYVAGIW